MSSKTKGKNPSGAPQDYVFGVECYNEDWEVIVPRGIERAGLQEAIQFLYRWHAAHERQRNEGTVLGSNGLYEVHSIGVVGYFVPREVEG